MRNRLKLLGASLSALVVAAALTFGATQLSATAMLPCGDDWWELGECPPYNQNSCNAECHELFKGPGWCMPTTPECCVCAV